MEEAEERGERRKTRKGNRMEGRGKKKGNR